MNRGLFWYLRPHSALSMNVGNPEANTFRIAYADYNNPQICYATILGANELEDVYMEYEDDDYWVYDYKVDGEYTYKYVIEDKKTRIQRVVPEKSGQSFILNQKK